MSREAMQMALEALESDPLSHAGLVSRKQAITAVRQALETGRNDLAKVGEVGVWGDVKPVAWMHTTATGLVYFRKKPQDKVFSPQAVYTAPPKREWVGLTDEDEIPWDGVDAKSFARAIEAKLKEKNHG